MSLARDITTVGGGTLMSRLLAYLRDAWIAALLGAGPYSEAFFAVLQVVNFFRRLLSEGALNSAFVPIWLKLRGGDDGAANANRFTRRVLLAMFCIAGIHRTARRSSSRRLRGHHHRTGFRTVAPRRWRRSCCSWSRPTSCWWDWWP